MNLTYDIPDDGKEIDLIRWALEDYTPICPLSMTLLNRIENNRHIHFEDGVMIKKAIGYILEKSDHQWVTYILHVLPLLPLWLIPDLKP
ncbi:MAG TPA: hypothetical protein VLG50_08240 [Candidatus Saccharimonadales bacterium]|nr:hypothetical protein [Candidatus Saccharimonadales bacterium]